ncbi:hypothetical protein AWB74_07604 [Caballeronia arvi]|uniref:Uncharacterized protein n=1 Tax=Caballeronia arvi TaxID=1777135 RepID=A0A158KZP5_9BURK|nr:hypothetical protein AWB74_07604 [Caballeronia arvi]
MLTVVSAIHQEARGALRTVHFFPLATADRVRFVALYVGIAAALLFLMPVLIYEATMFIRGGVRRRARFEKGLAKRILT